VGVLEKLAAGGRGLPKLSAAKGFKMVSLLLPKTWIRGGNKMAISLFRRNPL
jgi:hypothetical protein